MKKILENFGVGLPVFLLICLGGIEPIHKQELSPIVCRMGKWSLPSYGISSLAKTSPILIPRTPITCCQQDASCLDEMIYQRDGATPTFGDRKALFTAVEYSRRYLQSKQAVSVYHNYPIVGITRDRVDASLQRFQQLLQSTNSATELQSAIAKEFVFYQSVGEDAQGKVLFTAYYEPLYLASRTPTQEFRYPVYRLPPNLSAWSLPHPTRRELEGVDGLQGEKGKLSGLEIFWFRDRLEPYLIQIEGSARLQLNDGSQTSIGYAGNTAYTYNSVGHELIKDGKLPAKGVTMPIILDYFHKHPQELNIYIPRDRSFVFFQENHGSPAMGSLGQPLTAERSIATDKSLMPPGALAFIRAAFPYVDQTHKIAYQTVSRYVLDQDTGGAIKGPGRVDYFLGTGKIAGDRAGLTVSNGQLFYLLLKPKK